MSSLSNSARGRAAGPVASGARSYRELVVDAASYPEGQSACVVWLPSDRGVDGVALEFRWTTLDPVRIVVLLWLGRVAHS